MARRHPAGTDAQIPFRSFGCLAFRQRYHIWPLPREFQENLLLIALLYRFTLWQLLLIGAVSVTGLTFALSFALALASTQVDFNAGRVPRITSLTIMAVNLLWTFSLLVLAAWTVWYVFPDSEASVVLTTLNVQFSAALWLPIAALHAGLFLLTYVLWRRGVRHLNRWEVGD